MGTGKSSVGRLVAAQLHFQFVDTDEMIESRTGKKIADIFAQSGEPSFRELERAVVKELETYRKTVISTGGGLAVDPANLASLKEHALVVCLWARPETIHERSKDQKHRPLLDDPDPLLRIRELLESRTPAYRQADALISTEMRSIRDVVHQVVHQFRSKGVSPHY